jgi:hypothetical protein
MKNTTVTIWVSPDTEIHFFQYLKIISDLPIENPYTWRVKDISISKSMISNWVWVNLDVETYTKFIYSYKFNGGTF